MTPLAQAIANDACLPVAKRRFGSLADKIRLFDDWHFFECSAIASTALSISAGIVATASSTAREMTFLPAPRTFIEWDHSRVPGGRSVRVALLLEQDGQSATVSTIAVGREQLVSNMKARGRYVPRMLKLPLVGSPAGVNQITFRQPSPDEWQGEKWVEFVNVTAQEAIGFLAMINTPRIIGRRHHQPHAGLQRKIAASHGMPGKYPMHAWSEILLEVRPPRDASDSGKRETRLTGGRAEHFCRAHLRIWKGRSILVPAHRRGNPALGIKRTRYSVVPPRDGVWPQWVGASEPLE